MDGVRVIKKTVIVRRTTTPITVIRHPNIVKVYPNVPIYKESVFKAFSFTAIDGQSVFTLSSSYLSKGFVTLAINGTAQDPSSGDFVISGNTITIDSPLDVGDKVYGSYEEA